jgi:hypothetical protein
MMVVLVTLFSVIPAKAGIHILRGLEIMDSRLRGNDGSLLEGKL